MSDTPDGVVFLDSERQEWASMCAHCDHNFHYPGRQEAFVWRKLVDHLQMEHGVRRTWIENVDDRVAVAKQIALPLLFDLHQKARTKHYRYEG